MTTYHEQHGEASRTTQWVSHALSIAILTCFGLGGWFGTQGLRTSPAAVAHATLTQSDSPSASQTSPFVTKNIEDIEVGDLVLARDEHGTEIGWRPVVEVYRRTSHHLRHLKFRDSDGHEQALATTDEHPFFVIDTQTYVDAGMLIPGQKFQSADGKQQRLITTRREEHSEGIDVFNFQVEGFHTYFVAQTTCDMPILVHNASYGGDRTVGLVPKTGDDLLVRRGTGVETATRLGKQADAAEKAGFGHGVSVTSPNSNARLARDPHDAVSAKRKEIESAGFGVVHTPTRVDPDHHTVLLPKPVSKAIADLFNQIFGR